MPAIRSSSHGEHWPQTAKMHMKGMISVSPDSCIFPDIERAFLVGQLVENLLAVQETLFQFLGQEDPLEKG